VVVSRYNNDHRADVFMEKKIGFFKIINTITIIIKICNNVNIKKIKFYFIHTCNNGWSVSLIKNHWYRLGLLPVI
jgi:hypothetical protein